VHRELRDPKAARLKGVEPVAVVMAVRGMTVEQANAILRANGGSLRASLNKG